MKRAMSILLALLFSVAHASEIYWTDSSARKILRSAADGSNLQDVVVNPIEEPFGITLDPANGKIYWTDRGKRAIQRANLDGSNVEDLVMGTSPFRSPSSIVIDSAGGKMYWAEAGIIRRANLDGTSIEDLVDNGNFLAQDLVLDPAGGKIYFTFAATIRRMDLDGTDLEVLVTTGAFDLSELTLDTAAGKIYWAVGFAGGVPGKIQRANLDGSLVEDLVQTGSFPVIPRIAIDTAAGKMYWIDPQADVIRRANLDGSAIEDLVGAVVFNVEGIVLDPLAGKMYWVEVTAGLIRRANLDGSGIEDIVTGLSSPGRIALQESGETLFWTSLGNIQRAQSDGSNLEDLVSTRLVTPDAIVIDQANSKMYWSDRGKSSIQRANLDGTGFQILVADLDIPMGLALDVNANTIYWTEFGADAIRRADLDGSNVQDVVFTGFGPQTLAIDLAHDKLYWTELGGEIRRANLDGTFGEVVINEAGSFPPRGIALDVVAGDLYWAVATSSPPIASGVIKRADLNGSNIEFVVSTGGGQASNLSLDLKNRRIYWSRGGGEFTPPAVKRAGLDGSNPEILAASGFPQGVALDIPPEPLIATGLFFDAPNAFDSFAQVFETVPETATIGQVGSSAGVVKDIAVDPVTGLVYTIDLNSGPQGQQIYVVDPLTGDGTPLANTTGIAEPGFIWGLAFDQQGTLYGGGLGVYSIDTSSGSATPLAGFDRVPALIFGMTEFPANGGFLSTGVLLTPDGFWLPYLAIHGSDGAFVPNAIGLVADASGEGRILFDIAFTPNGAALYGIAWPSNLLFSSASETAQRILPGGSQRSLSEARPAQLKQQRSQVTRKTRGVSQQESSFASDLVLIEVVGPYLLMSPGAPLQGAVTGLGGAQ